MCTLSNLFLPSTGQAESASSSADAVSDSHVARTGTIHTRIIAFVGLSSPAARNLSRAPLGQSSLCSVLSRPWSDIWGYFGPLGSCVFWSVGALLDSFNLYEMSHVSREPRQGLPTYPDQLDFQPPAPSGPSITPGDPWTPK